MSGLHKAASVRRSLTDDDAEVLGHMDRSVTIHKGMVANLTRAKNACCEGSLLN